MYQSQRLVWVVVCTTLCLIFMAEPGLGHTMGLGQCPKVTPMSDFNMDQFMGEWYVIQKFGTSSSCYRYNFTKGDDGKLRLVQTRQHFILDTIGVDHIYTYTGVLTVPESGTASKMRVKFPLSVAGDAEFLIYATDYNNYAGIYTCQKVTVAHRMSATILSRKPTLDEATVNELRMELKEEGVNPDDFDVVEQGKCIANKDATFNVKVDDQTFSSGNVADTLKKVGGVLESGVEKASDLVGSGVARALNPTSSQNDEENFIP